MSSTPVQSVSTIREAIPLLRRPFTPAALKFKIQVNPKGETGKALIVAFIDSRLVSERLNAVGPDMWTDSYEPVQGGMRCTIELSDTNREGPFIGSGVRRSDVGWSKGTGSDMDLKALYSDAFKRAGVKFGIGVSVYAMPQQWLDSEKGEIKKIRSGWAITNKGLATLRASYASWLKTAANAFGEPLDHGDVDNSQGDAEVDGPARESGAQTAEAKPEPKPKAKPAGERKVSKAGIEAVKQEMLLSTKTGDDVRNFLVAKGVEDASDLDAALAGITSDQAKELHGWLKKHRAEGAGVEAA